MSKNVRIYYRTTLRTTKLILGEYIDNGAENAKIKVIRDYFGAIPAGERIKAPLDGRQVTLRIDPAAIEEFKAADPAIVEKMMRKRQNEKFYNWAERLINS